MKYKGIPGIIILAASLFSCKPAEVLLHGSISGIITDSETSKPIQGVSTKLINTVDSSRTGSDGSFLFKNLIPGQYEIKALKAGYDSLKQNIEVVPAETKQVAFSLNGIPVPRPSVTYLDFSLDSTSLRFSIINLGKGKFSYAITPSQDWITVSPPNGNITDSLKIKVTINKTGLSQNLYNETLTLFTVANQVSLPEIIIPVNLNGISDHDGNNYKVVRIGSQIWMAQNLNVGAEIPVDKSSANNGIIEKHCYSDSKSNCDIYGGLYQWDEMMQYAPSDSGLVGTTQGICPVGWHIPTKEEWTTLAKSVGGQELAGAPLKEAGFSHWLASTVVATNNSGFTALPGGAYGLPGGYFNIQNLGNWWTSIEDFSSTSAYYVWLSTLYEPLLEGTGLKEWGLSVRCVKNPAK